MSYFERLAAPAAAERTPVDHPAFEREELFDVATAPGPEPTAWKREPPFDGPEPVESLTASTLGTTRTALVASSDAAREAPEVARKTGHFQREPSATRGVPASAVPDASAHSTPVKAGARLLPSAEPRALPDSATPFETQAVTPSRRVGSSELETVRATHPVRPSEARRTETLDASPPLLFAEPTPGEPRELGNEPNDEPTLNIGSVEIHLLPNGPAPAPRIARPAASPRPRPEAPLAWLTRNRVRGLR